MRNFIKYMILSSVTILCACNNQNSQDVDNTIVKYNSDIQKCYDIRLRTDSTDCLECFKKVSKDYPDSLVPYLIVADEYQNLEMEDSSKRLYGLLLRKFGNRTEILYQKNFFTLWKYNKYVKNEIKILRKRREDGLLTEQQVNDMVFLENVIINGLPDVRKEGGRLP